MSPLLLALLAIPQSPPPFEATHDDRPGDDAAPRAAYAKLSPSERADLAEYFRLEASHLGSFQSSLIAFVLKGQDGDPKNWPEDRPAPSFDSREHTPENDIPRHLLPADSPEVARIRTRFFEKVPRSRLRSAWRYDYASRGLVRAKDWKDPDRIFENGLAGYPPDLDLAQALVERALDDGAEQKALAAFAHAYTDRDGGVYPGVTLYDALASGAEIEMPDVDTLGIVHTLLGDWKTWRAPVPAEKHDALYERVGELFVPAHRHRGLRHAVAVTFLEGGAVLADGYSEQLDNLHALWEDCKSTPAEMKKRLPTAAKRTEFLKAWTKKCKQKPAIYQAGVRRHRTLDGDSQAVRALLLRLLDEFAPRGTAGGKDKGRAGGGKPR